MVLNGTAEQRNFALDTLGQDVTIRTARVGLAELRKGSPRWRPRRVPRLRRPRDSQRKPERCVYDAENARQLPGNQARCEGESATGDVAVDEAYDGLGNTLNLYREIFYRNSIDDRGMSLKASVHYGRNYDNAFWDGRMMVFGDGDVQLFNRFTIALDVIGHELTHGVTDSEGGLTYFGQSGALNESISDVFGSLVKQYQRNETVDMADWLIGEGLFLRDVGGKQALRSMAEPGTAYDDPNANGIGKDPQPGHMKDYVYTNKDNGGVHINSGIPNRAFYLVATAITGPAWQKAGLIWYTALTSRALRPGTQFRRFALLTVRAATRLFSADSSEVSAVRNGWAQVGINV
jgi:Zn-dependent metalloprotease